MSRRGPRPFSVPWTSSLGQGQVRRHPPRGSSKALIIAFVMAYLFLRLSSSVQLLIESVKPHTTSRPNAFEATRAARWMPRRRWIRGRLRQQGTQIHASDISLCTAGLRMQGTAVCAAIVQQSEGSYQGRPATAKRPRAARPMRQTTITWSHEP